MQLPPRLKRSTELFRSDGLFKQIFFLLCVLYLFLFGLNSVSRTRHFSPDSMNYVDVAQHVVSGHGLVQSSLGFNDPQLSLDHLTPAPFTSQPPGYPLMIALLGRFGLPLADAALLIPVAFYGLCLISTYLFAKLLFDEPVALLALGLVLVYYPLQYVSGYAWSEAAGIGFVLASYCLLAFGRCAKRYAILLASLAGLAAGFAFDTRYALVPFFVFGGAFLIERHNPRQTLRNLSFYLLGFVIPVLPVLYRNLSLTGRWMGAELNPSTVGLMQNITATLTMLFGNYLDGPDANLQITLLTRLLVLLCAILLIRRTFTSVTRFTLYENKRYVLGLASVGYLVFLVYLRTISHFDPIDARLTAPAGVMLVLIAAALIAKTLSLQPKYLLLAALVLATIPIERQARLFIETPPYDQELAIRGSGRLSWIRQRTDDLDLIVGDYTIDLPFYLGRTRVVSLTEYPYSAFLQYDQLEAFLVENCSQYRNVYVVLRKRYSTESDWKSNYGPFISDVVYGRTGEYPGIFYRRDVGDALIFQVDRPECLN